MSLVTQVPGQGKRKGQDLLGPNFRDGFGRKKTFSAPKQSEPRDWGAAAPAKEGERGGNKLKIKEIKSI